MLKLLLIVWKITKKPLSKCCATLTIRLQNKLRKSQTEGTANVIKSNFETFCRDVKIKFRRLKVDGL